MSRPMGGRAPRGDGGVQWFRALVLIAVLVVIGILILAKTTSTPAAKTSTRSGRGGGPTTTATTAPSTTTAVAALSASQVKVQVLNGLRSGNLSSQWITKLKSQYGYQTGPADDATSTVTASTIYVITPGAQYVAAANQLAARIGLSPSAVNPTVPAPSTAPIPAAERATSNLVLIVGSDLAGHA